MILGVDLGQRKTGISISQGNLAAPLTTIFHKSASEAVKKIAEICQKESIDTVVVGYVEGKTKEQFEKFAKLLKGQTTNINVVLWDETLTTRQAQRTMIKLKIPKTKRKEKEHETAASLILQSYLDEIND